MYAFRCAFCKYLNAVRENACGRVALFYTIVRAGRRGCKMELVSLTILEIAIVACVALGGGILFARLKLPDILAYLLTGVVVGPSVLSLIPSREQVHVLAELGVLLLLFVIGLELNVKTFKENLFTSTTCVCLQVVAGLAVSFFVGLFFDWPLYFKVAIGFVGALSSTAVVVNMLESSNMAKSKTGVLALGILIAQDIAVVPMIIILNALTGHGGDFRLLAKVLAAMAFMAIFIGYLNVRPKTNIDPTKFLGSNPDLYLLAALSICFAAAAIAGGVGVTAPYGAFLAGLTLGNLSDNNNLFLRSVKPIQNLFMMIFFLSIGILLDLQFVRQHIWVILLLLLMVTIVKTLINIIILRLLQVRLAQASFVGLALAQLGEFAFLLTTILDGSRNASFLFAQKCLISITVLSLAFSPLWLRIGRRIQHLTRKSQSISSRTMIHCLFGYAWASLMRKAYSLRHTTCARKIVLRYRKLRGRPACPQPNIPGPSH